jgi:hypothetical protein
MVCSMFQIKVRMLFTEEQDDELAEEAFFDGMSTARFAEWEQTTKRKDRHARVEW